MNNLKINSEKITFLPKFIISFKKNFFLQYNDRKEELIGT